MEAGIFLRSMPLIPSGHHLPSFRQYSRISANLQGGYKGPRPKTEVIADWVSNNDDAVRSLPIYVGGISLLGVLFNRTASGIAPVADASSSQSRADLLTIGLAVTNILAGLVWLSIRPKTISVVPPRGVECERIHSNIPDVVASELTWAWESLETVTCCRSLVIVYDGVCVLQIGYASVSSSNDGEGPTVVDSVKLMQGSIYQGVIKSGSQSYLANLSLYPGKSELPFLPSNTQAVILQPIGDKGIAILGGDTIRGFTTSDQFAFYKSMEGVLEHRDRLFGSLNRINLDRRTSANRNTVPPQVGSPDHAVPARKRIPIGYTTIQYVDRGFPGDLGNYVQNLQAWITLIGEKLDATLSKHITSSIPLPSGTTT